MIRLTMLPGQDGDCLLLEYGSEDITSRVLIDGGRAGTYPDIIPTLNDAGAESRLDRLVVTHVDQDHILGVLALMEDEDRPAIDDVWFNGFDQLMDVDPTLESFGPQDGELFTSALLAQEVPWNAAFEGRAVEVGHAMELPDDGSTITLLSPDRSLLEALIGDWREECEANGLLPGRDPEEPPPKGFEDFGTLDIEELADTAFERDGSKTNRTSIGFLFEHGGVRIMFTGDGDDPRLVESVRPLAEAEGGGRLRLDALKVSHHGSRKNLSRDLLDLIDCPRYLISTNGDRHDHPDPVAMARILKYGGDQKELVFNYQERAADWDVAGWRETYGYTVTTPDPDGFVTLDWG